MDQSRDRPAITGLGGQASGRPASAPRDAGDGWAATLMVAANPSPANRIAGRSFIRLDRVDLSKPPSEDWAPVSVATRCPRHRPENRAAGSRQRG